MAEPIESVLTKFIDKKIDLDHACEAISTWSLSHRGDDKFISYGTELLSELYAEHKIGEGIHQKLLQAIHNPTHSDDDATKVLTDDETGAVGENDGKTVMMGRDNDDDATQVLAEDETGAVGENDGKTVMMSRDSDDDATKVLAENEAGAVGENDGKTVMMGQDDSSRNAVDDDITVIAGDATTDDDSTVIGNPDDNFEDDDATVVAGSANSSDEDDDATIVADAAGGAEKTRIMTDAERTGQSQTGQTASTKKDTTDMTGRDQDFGIIHATDDEEGEELVVGSILKDRFNLVSILGEGGMGLVFKAVDMLKVEAKDQNPYVAIKVLTGDFKEHPDAFISLQRETSKAQKLAHPNISTVYDFDRHKGTVYMTMELLNGEPLDEFIKDKMPKDGLPEKLALSIVKGLGDGLEYAHEQGLVHSDFKPGNAFIIDPEEIEKMDHIEAGGVKVIDFGIARAAATSTGEKSLHEDDVFDAGSLGALTPAYATIEMYNGDDPHPSDDIYALACVACQLLTGQHPYKKKPAPKAKDMKLRPPLIPGFTKRQQRALEKALAFERKDRTESVEEFLEGIRRRKDYTWQIIGYGSLFLAAIGGLGYTPVTNYFEQQEIQQLIVATNEGSDEGVKSTLTAIQAKSEDYQTSVKVGIRDRALEVYVKDINALVDPAKKRYEYEQAEGTIDEVLNYYPDSSVVAAISTRVAESKAVLLDELHLEYVQQLLKKNFLPIDDSEDITDVLKQLKRVASDDPVFSDPRLARAYHGVVKQSISKSDYDSALTYLKVANDYIPKSALFNDLGDQVITSTIDNQLVLEQTKTENSFSGRSLTIHDYKNYTDDLMILSLNSTFRSNYYNDFKTKFEKEFSKLASSSPTAAKDLFTTFSKALTADNIISYYERTGLAPNLSGSVSASSFPRIHFIKDKGANLDTVIKQITELRIAVEKYRNNVLTHYNVNFETSMDPLVATLRPTLIDYYTKLYASLLIPDTRRSINKQITLATNNLNANVRNVYALANVENDKRIFRNFANENRLNDSIDKYNSIAKVATESDNEFIEYAKAEIARMYATLAESKATEYVYTDAYNYILKAKEYITSEALDKQERNYKKEVKALEVAELIITEDETDKIKALEILEFMKSEYPDDYKYILQGIAENVNISIIELAKTELIEAHRLKKHALTIVNNRTLNIVPINPLPAPSLLAAQGKIEVSQNNLTAAKATLAAATAATPDHYQVKELREILYPQVERAEEYYSQHIKYFNEENYDDADRSLASAIENWKDNPDYRDRRAFYDKVMVQVNAGSKLCREDLQGIGKRNRGACNDVVMSTKKRAPTMVVIPPINKDSQPYAISKYEISAADLNAFCEKSEQCTPVSEDLAPFPATKIPVQIITAYADWLSNETGFKYKIASYDEWTNATSAAGREGNSDYNCRLRLGTKLIKGQNIVPVESGAQNNWGLINYVGNVDEIVQDGDNYKLVGGNFSDSISDCKISLSKPFENVTATSGFRLVRELF